MPEESVRTLEAVGAWLKRGGEEAIFGTDSFTFDLRERGDHRGDWNHNGPFSAKGNTLYQLVRRWTGETLIVTGVGVPVHAVTLLGAHLPLKFTQVDGKVTVTGLPAMPPDPLCPVLRFDCDRPPTIYVTGGQRTPRVPHPHYDPCPSDLAH